MTPEATSDTSIQPRWPTDLLALSTFMFSKLGIETRRRSCEVLGTSESLMPGHQALIFSLAEFGPASQRELSDRLCFDASDVVALVDELERRKWVERKVDARDRRRYAVTLTDEGEQARERLSKAMSRLNEEFLSVLDAEERAVLPFILRKLLGSFDPRVPR